MGMSAEIDQLVRLMPPPPGEVAGPPWQLSATEIGLEFPEDYREFVDRYGAGLAESDTAPMGLTVKAPHSGAWRPGGAAGFRGFTEKHAARVRPAFVFDSAGEDYWGGIVYPVFPDAGGVLSWGDSGEGDFFFWLTGDPDPNRWPVVMWPRHQETSYRFEGGMVAFLVAVFTGAHPASDWLGGPGLRWTMESDWERRGLSVSAGPAVAG
jgi:hypothetical protein